MRPIWILGLVLSATAGCATIGPVPSDQGSASSRPDATSSPSLFSTQGPDTTPSLPDMSPRLILPAGGGPPVMAIPLGGNVYLPLNADPVTVGIPLSP
jgi:hypothetical protein